MMMNPNQLIPDGVDVLVLDLAFHARNNTGMARCDKQGHCGGGERGVYPL